MSASENKQRLQQAFDALAQGDGAPFVELMADDFTWMIIGTTRWSRTYRGKRAVLDELLRPLFQQFATQYTSRAQRIIAEDDYAVVECRGRVITKSGKPYNNEYCYVIRFAQGKMLELNEYLDTELLAGSFAS